MLPIWYLTCFFNKVINTLALFLFPEERDRSSHTRKEHQYMPDLYAQGVLAQVKDLAVFG